MKFAYLEPKSLEEALRLLVQHRGEAKVIAGGTDVVMQARKKLIDPRVLVDITHIEGLSGIALQANGAVRIGALTTLRAIEDSVELRASHPVIPQAASQLGSIGIRNQATVGGNLCNAAPSAETAPAFIVTGSLVRIVGPKGIRTVETERLFAGVGRSVLGDDELLTEIEVPGLGSDCSSVYLKHAYRGSVDCAIVGAAVALWVDAGSGKCRDVRIALSAVAPTPIRAYRAEAVVRGSVLSDLVCDKAAAAALSECSCISDVRASAKYREEMVAVLVRTALRENRSRLKG